MCTGGTEEQEQKEEEMPSMTEGNPHALSGVLLETAGRSSPWDLLRGGGLGPIHESHIHVPTLKGVLSPAGDSHHRTILWELGESPGLYFFLINRTPSLP